MKTTKRSYKEDDKEFADTNKKQPLQPPDNPEAPKKIIPELKLDGAETKTEDKTKAKTRAAQQAEWYRHSAQGSPITQVPRPPLRKWK